MKRRLLVSLAAIMTISALTACSSSNQNTLNIAKEGMFSSGGTVTQPVAGKYDEKSNWLDSTRAGNTAHVDHANVLYQNPENDNGNPIVYLHGYGQSRMGWMTTPDGRDGWAEIFLKNGAGCQFQLAPYLFSRLFIHSSYDIHPAHHHLHQADPVSSGCS